MRLLDLRRDAKRERVTAANCTETEEIKIPAGEVVTVVQNSNQIELPIMPDTRVPKNCAWIASGNARVRRIAA